MFGLFSFGRTTTDNTEEILALQHAELDRINTDNLMVRMRHTHTMEMEDRLDQAHRDSMRIIRERNQLRSDLAASKRETARLLAEHVEAHIRYEALFDVALEMAEKLKATKRSEENASRFRDGYLLLPDEFQAKRDEAERAIREDPARVERLKVIVCDYLND
jgi:hypothetical protein